MEQQDASSIAQNNLTGLATVHGANEQNKLLHKLSDQSSPMKTDLQINVNKDIYSEEEMRNFTKRGIISLIGGVILHIELGTFYVWGSISPYVCAWMREKDKDVTLNFMAIIFPILGIITMSVLSFGIKIAEKIGFKVTIGIGSFTIALAFLIISFIQHIGGFIAVYCIMVGISGGLLYMLPIICGWRYFPNRRGLVSGMTIGGYGFGSFIFNFVCKAVANPNNLKPSVIEVEDGKDVKYFDSEVGDKVPLMLQVLAASYFGLGIIATIMVRYPAEIDPDKMLATLEAEEKKKRKEGAPAPPPPVLPAHKECVEIKRGMKHPSFVLLQLIVLMSCTFGMLISNCYKYYGLELGIDDATLTATGSVAGVMNGSSRFFWATLTDKTSYKFTFTIISILNLITTAILPYNKDGIGYLLLIAVVYLAEGGLLATYPVICAKIYGKKIGGLMYGFMFFFVGVANMIGYILYAFARKKIKWEGVFWICFALNVIGIILGLVLKEVGYDWRDQAVIDAEKEKEKELQNKGQLAAFQN
ncbi:unnamed protein product (macronuclear) [Paramecium tetraurelia]|uniref:Major facilitator superfamily (MFS) profile domain-containing protein n=1 Tax=Paramecium tetraurelia TaxID=5888 RepID=A0E3P8_PARTE|nr:uncharacterized protein GSPATT00023088001 [Paramecium tetraurelia]CAK89915.1 unnamed protein product [Paramecium tetraurelia]|eukprot:XP_001457312.1 hypothetical protein (macronuclear) [Paramecium tetraurelia strain d4-2]